VSPERPRGGDSVVRCRERVVVLLPTAARASTASRTVRLSSLSHCTARGPVHEALGGARVDVVVGHDIDFVGFQCRSILKQAIEFFAQLHATIMLLAAGISGQSLKLNLQRYRTRPRARPGARPGARTCPPLVLPSSAPPPAPAPAPRSGPREASGPASIGAPMVGSVPTSWTTNYAQPLTTCELLHYFIYESLTIPLIRAVRAEECSDACGLHVCDPRPARTLRRSMHSAEPRWFPLFLEVFALHVFVVVLACLLIGLLH
jgi:hypothetical protein